MKARIREHAAYAANCLRDAGQYVERGTPEALAEAYAMMLLAELELHKAKRAFQALGGDLVQMGVERFGEAMRRTEAAAPNWPRSAFGNVERPGDRAATSLPHYPLMPGFKANLKLDYRAQRLVAIGGTVS